MSKISKDQIITPDRVLALCNGWISRYGTNFTDFNEQQNKLFIKPDYMNIFKSEILPKIKFPFYLFTHDSDIPVTSEHMDLLTNPLLIKWFGMNCHLIHDKLCPIPIGMANEVWPHGNKDIIMQNQNIEKTKFVYSNFKIETNARDRTYALQKLKEYDWIDHEQPDKPFGQYIHTLAQYKYTISPPGNSTDCHRVWESIYLGVVPIVLKSIPMVSFQKLPILFINRWEDLTKELLEEKYEKIKSRSIEQATLNYYNEKVHNNIRAV